LAWRSRRRAACLAVLISFLTWNYFINAMGMTWGHFFGVDFSAEPTAGSGWR
jgi:PTS system arbutin-like IIC component